MTGRASRAKQGEPRRFYEQALAYDGDECLLWPYATNGDGYPQMRDGGKVVYVHRLVLEDDQGPPPEPGMEAAHAPVVCHQRLCLTKRHLRWATPAENAADRVLDGTQQRGVGVWSATLTPAKVRDIRASDLTQVELARRYGVAQNTISRVINGVLWAHV